MTSKNFLLIGVVIGLVTSVGVALLLSMASAPTLAQNDSMMGMQQDQMQEMGTADNNNTTMGGMSMLGASAMSMVSDVKVTGVAMQGDNQISVDLRYTGNRSAPAVIVVAMSYDGMMMAGGDMMNANSSDHSMTMQDHSTMMSMQGDMNSGGNVISAGWQSPTTVTIKLDGTATTSTSDMTHIMAMVFPFLE